MTTFDRYIKFDGTISIANGASTVTGVGTTWGGIDRQGSLLLTATGVVVGVVAALDNDAAHSDLSLPLKNLYAGTTLSSAAYILLPPPAMFRGTDQAAIYAEYNAFLRNNAGLFFKKSEIVAKTSQIPNNSLAFDEATKTLQVWRDGAWEIVYAVGAPWAMQGLWDGGTGTALVISGGATTPNLTTSKHFTLNANATVAIQLPTNCAVGDQFDIVTTGDGSHVASFASGYIVGDAFRTANGAKSRIRCTVQAQTGGTATSVTGEMVEFDRNDAVAYGGNFWVSAIDGNTDEPLSGSLTWVQMPITSVIGNTDVEVTVDSDASMAANSDARIPTQKAVKTALSQRLLGSNNLSDLVSASSARGNLGLGSAAVKSTGTSGNNVPLLDGSNTWSAFNQIASTAAPLFRIARSDNANVGAIFDFDHVSASPAVGDQIGYFRFFGRNSAAAAKQYASFYAQLTDPVSATEDADFVITTIVGGSDAVQANFGGGVTFGSPTGGKKGTGTLNATAVYDDNTLLTCMALSEEFLTTGKIDLTYWDSLVPPLIEPARKQTRTLTKTVRREALRRDKTDGSLVADMIEDEIPLTYLTPVYDAEGNGIGAVEETATEVVEVPEKVTPRPHVVARLFQGMLDDGFDPRSPAAYVSKLRADHALPGMPRMDQWQHNGISNGEMFCRLWLAAEMMALVMANHEGRIAAIEEEQSSAD